MTDESTAIVIETKDLARSFGTGQNACVAVKGLSFSVRRGEIFGVLGPNGAGKTTTIRMLSSLLKPTSGEGKVLGIDISDDRRTKELRRRINVVSGGERGLYYRLTGRQNLSYFADLYAIPVRTKNERISEVLELVGMTADADRPVEEYSRGMKQRIHIAKSLINDPYILFLDEPTIGLDPEISIQIRGIIRSLAEGGMTIILTTHYMHEAEELCDRIILLKKGSIVGNGTVDDLRAMVSDDRMIRVVTTEEPSSAAGSLKGIPGFKDCRIDELSGRYEISVRCDKDSDPISEVESIFSGCGIRSIGYDQPTLEETYLYLTGGD